MQAHVNVAFAASTTSGLGTSYGPADLELGVKYRFIEAKPEDWWPQIAIYPFLDLPTRDASLGLGTGSVHAFLPVWLQKDFGKWTTYGGGSYWINPGPGNWENRFTGWPCCGRYRIPCSLAANSTIKQSRASVVPVAGLSDRHSQYNGLQSWRHL